MQEALGAVAAGDLDRADALLAQIADPERRREISDAVNNARDQQDWEKAI